jgi:ergothioneine biosynthesis protein EgtB
VSQHEDIADAYRRVRATTERLAAPLSPEDQCVQSAPDCSPTKWHRAHTTWFFETFVLEPEGVAPVDARWGFLWNSYYDAVGPRHGRSRRGMLTRPSTAEVGSYRRTVDERITALLHGADPPTLARLAPIVTLGLAHEQQHQELLLTDALHALHESPLAPVYRDPPVPSGAPGDDALPLAYAECRSGLVEVGEARGAPGFRFDNEEPAHRVWLDAFALANRLVTVREWRAFADDGGYTTPSLWLAEGFDWITANHVRAPLYGRHEDGRLHVFGLDGLREARDDEPVTHLSYFEADALAHWLGARLPTEAEWEIAARDRLVRGSRGARGNWLEGGALRALPAAPTEGGIAQLYGDAWEWTQSAYAPYPGFAAAAGAVGEYNGKFMVNQYVLRGGSCFTPEGHVRPTYRNFWPSHTRFQVTGVRLARSLERRS